MNKNLFLFSALTLIICFSSCIATKGDGNIVSEEHKISDFHSITLFGSGNLYYEQKDEEPYIRIETDKNILDLINIEVVNGVLLVKETESIMPSKLNIYTNSKQLKLISSYGSAHIELMKNISSDQLKVELLGSGEIIGKNILTSDLIVNSSGSGSVSIENLSAEKADVNLSGSGEIYLKGKSFNTKSDLKGSGQIHMFNLESSTASCDISGSGKITIYATKELNTSISGSGSVIYKGNPILSTNVSGSGLVRKEE